MYLKFAEEVPENEYDYENLEEILIRRPIPFFWKQTVPKNSRSKNRIEPSRSLNPEIWLIKSGSSSVQRPPTVPYGSS